MREEWTKPVSENKGIEKKTRQEREGGEGGGGEWIRKERKRMINDEV